ncbi:MAG: shikimate dehydrogenase [Firmicutes bacterium]|nr:shikimate dehydrogenase [Bacillota bacterium]
MIKDININTKLTAIIGTDIGHSKSPAMMNAAFRELGLDYYYFPMNIKEDDFSDVIRGISKMNFAGLTITIPYKIEVIKYLDEIDRTAQIIGAVNTVKIEDGRLKGYNTDGEGFVRGLEADKGVNIADSAFVVTGAGGVSRAIMTVLASRKAAADKKQNGINISSCDKKIYLANRTFEKAEELCRKLNELVCDCCVPLHLNEELRAYIKKADVLINATNIGMPPFENETPINSDMIHNGLLAADVIYNPRKTKFLKQAEEAGCDIVNGQSLLLHQGKIAFKIWTGLEAPTTVMFKAVFGSEEHKK